jgi:pimeloyl-ACP methyl ester carboxylesterase
VDELRVDRDGCSLAVSYSPAGETAIIALHGASVGERDHVLYRHLHELLPPAGIGVVTFDRRGDGSSTGEPSRGHFQLQADDALAVAEAVGLERIGLWGFSQGGWVAPLAATQSERVRFLVLLASTGVTPAEQMRYAASQQILRAGYGTDIAERATRLRLALEDWIHDAGPAPVDELERAAQEPWWALAFLPEELFTDEERQEWIDEMDWDPFPVFSGVRVPTLLFYGDDDAWTPVEPSIETWRRARGDAVDVVVLPGTGHEPVLADGSISPLYEERLVDWLTALVRR